MKKIKKVLVVIITYNDEDFIINVIKKVPKDLRIKNYEILIIDDNSTDQTFSKIRNFLKENKTKFKINFVENKKNKGYGRNQKIGYVFAIKKNFDIAVMVHGDEQFGPDKIDKMIEPIMKDHADLVLGSRMLKKTDALKGNMPLYKFLGNILLTFVQNIFLNANLSEYHTGYRAFSVKSLKKIPFIYNTDGFPFDNEILIQFIMKKLRIKEIPIPTSYTNQISNLKVIPYGLRVLKTLFLAVLQRLGVCDLRKYRLDSNIKSSKLENRIFSEALEGMKFAKTKEN